MKQSSLHLLSKNNSNSNSARKNKNNQQLKRIKRLQSKSHQKHKDDEPSGGIEAIIPSLLIVIVLGCGFAAKMGFRGRANIAGIDLGTTNSVVCVQQQADGPNLGKIECIPDPLTNSPIIPSVISILDHHHHHPYSKKKKKDETTRSFHLDPHPSRVVVGSAAQRRINTHPQHTIYHAKRVLGRLCNDDAVDELGHEVEFQVSCNSTDTSHQSEEEIDETRLAGHGDIIFQIPTSSSSTNHHHHPNHPLLSMQPHQVGSYIINHLMEITQSFLKHDSVQSAVIAVPAKFDRYQRAATIRAFRNAGVSVARVMDEPVAAALAYGLQKKDGVNYIMVYDFGGGTLDVSILYVSDSGYVEVMGNDGDNSLGGVDFDVAIAHSLLEADDHKRGIIRKRTGGVLKEIERILVDGGGLEEEDMEELVSSQCPKLEEVPLCTLSSFHTIGEKMKIELSSLADGEDTVFGSCLGLHEDVGTTPESIPEFCSLLEPVELKLTKDQYNKACQHLFDRSVDPIRRIMKEMNLEKEEIDEVVMVGGTTRMPQIRSLVKEELAVSSLNTHIDPDLTVAYGAASVMD